MAVKIDGYDLPVHISYSALTTWLDCGWKYWLTRVVKEIENPTWYLAGGSAVHTATEMYDKELYETEGRQLNKYWDAAWAAQQAEQLTKTGIDQALWRAAGRATKANPNKEDGDWWNENGSMMVDQWIKWRNGVNGWTMWQHNGIPAVELALNPIWHDVPVQMHLDRVMVNPDGELVVLDIKTGARTPSSDLQLAFYAAGMEEILGVRPKWGAYWMGRTGITTEMVDLDKFPKEYIIEIVSKFDRARKDGIFIPNFSHCIMCQLKDKCKYKTGGN